MGKLSKLLIIAILLVFPSSLLAQTVGSYATYKWTSNVEMVQQVIHKSVSPEGKMIYKVAKESVKQSPIYLTYSILNATDKDYLMQVVAKEAKGTAPLAISQILVDKKTGKILKAVTKSPKGASKPIQPAKELMPISEKDVAKGKKADFMVEDKSCSCIYGTVNGNAVCVSDKVPPLGIVMAVLDDGTIELVESSSKGAKDLIKTK